MNNPEIIRSLMADGAGVMMTDTIYGLVGRALSEKAVKKIYQLKGRDGKKPFIILISTLDDLELFGIELVPENRKLLGRIWPGKISVILPCRSEKFSYLHRRTDSLAFRLPAKKSLRELLRKTGPLVAPSANPEGQSPAGSLKEARRYFSDRSDFYSRGMPGSPEPSTLIALKSGKIEVLRKGADFERCPTYQINLKKR